MNELEREVPGFGGFYADDQGIIHVWVAERSQRDRARNAIMTKFATARIPRRGRGIPQVVIDSARFTFGQLADWREALFERAATGVLRQVRVIDLDERRNRVRVEVDSDPDGVRREALARGIDTAALVIQPFTPMQQTRALQTYPDPNNYVSPVIAGISIRWSGPYQTGPCTLGFVASVGGVKRFVTAAHCSEIKYQTEATSISQPFSGPTIGSELSDPSPSNCFLSYYAFWARCRASDAALFSFTSGVQAEVGLIARTATRNNGGFFGSPTALTRDQTNPFWVIDNVEANNWWAGLVVEKLGTTTGWTWGTITDTCFDYLGPDGQKGITCAYAADLHVSGGDSGGPIFYIHPEGDGRVTLGGIMAGIRNNKAVFSKYNRINNDLGGNLVAVRVATLGTPTLSGSVAGVVPTISWPAVAGATYYRVYRQWYRYSTEQGSSGYEFFLVNTNSFTDPNLTADAYTGGSMPNLPTPGYIRYYVRPMSALESGGSSNVVNFHLTP